MTSSRATAPGRARSNQAALDTALHRADEQTRRRFGEALRRAQATAGATHTPTPQG